MTTPEQRAEYSRLENARQMQADEMRRQMQADEMRRQMQADEMRRAETNREVHKSVLNHSLAEKQEASRAEVAREAAHEVYGQCTGCRSPGGAGGLCPRCRDARDAAAPGVRGAADGVLTESSTLAGVRDEARRAEVAREAAHEVYGQCTECRSPGGAGGLCPRCRAARDADAPATQVGAGSYESTRANIWKLDNPSSEEAQPGHQTIDSPGVAKNDRDRAPMFADEWDDRDKRRFDEGRWLSEDDEVRRGTERGRSDGAATESLIQTASGEEGRRTEVAREAAHEVYGQCTECRSPGGIGGLCPRCRDARAADAPTQEATILEYQRSYASNFDKTPQLNDLWTRACKDADDDFRSARRNFWTLVNTDSSPEAQFVRQMIQAAGFTVDDRECAPMLADEWDDRKKGRYNNARRLSIDHEVPQSKKPDLSMVASNLRFMLMDDNLRRGAHYGAGEKPYD